MEVVLIIIGLFAATFVYYTIKEKAKRNIFFKDQYEEQKSYTHQDTIILANAPLESVRAGVAGRFPVDDSLAATIVGGNYELVEDTPTCLEYKRGAKLTTGGGGDEFQVRITFKSEGAARTRVKATTTHWREHDGVTRRKGIEAMRDFYDELFAAVRGVDPSATWSRSGTTPTYREDQPASQPSPAATAATGAGRATPAAARAQATQTGQKTRPAGTSSATAAGAAMAKPAVTRSGPQTAPARNIRPAGRANAPAAQAATPKFCPHCGARLLPNASFCPHCGSPVRARAAR